MPHRATMNRQLNITNEPIDEAALSRQRTMSAGMGAVVNFLGVVRGEEAGKSISALEYEAFRKWLSTSSACSLTKWRSAGRLNPSGSFIVSAWCG
ncbi:MAG: molybdenum cofactor biosynthesis protein MoaE [Verrucomicrobiota bacterium]